MTKCIKSYSNIFRFHVAHAFKVENKARHCAKSGGLCMCVCSIFVGNFFETRSLVSVFNTFRFALDETGDVISSLGGSTMLPQTIILNKEGVVTYNMVGSVTYEKLEELVKEAGK